MSSDHVLPTGARRATHAEALRTFENVRAIVREFHYTVGLLGSTLRSEGMDIDLVIVSAIDCVTAAHRIASALVSQFATRILEYEELDEHAQSISLTYIQRNKTVVDVYIVGLPE